MKTAAKQLFWHLNIARELWAADVLFLKYFLQSNTHSAQSCSHQSSVRNTVIIYLVLSNTFVFRHQAYSACLAPGTNGTYLNLWSQVIGRKKKCTVGQDECSLLGVYVYTTYAP